MIFESQVDKLNHGTDIFRGEVTGYPLILYGLYAAVSIIV